MRRTLACMCPTALAVTGVRFARFSKASTASESPEGSEKNPVDNAPTNTLSSDAALSVESMDGEHVHPQKVLQTILASISEKQLEFMFGRDKKTRECGEEDNRATGMFFESIKNAYEGRMLQERQVETEKYSEKRRMHYAQRLEKETIEFKEEQEEIHREIQRLESEKYKVELSNDVLQFAKAREAEYEARLYADVEKYFSALRAFQSRAKKSPKGKPVATTMATQLTMDISAVMEEMELEDSIRSFGDDATDASDLSDQDIRSYVIQRTCFYEKCAQDEIHDFTRKRKQFYEQLTEARSVRHAAKARADTEKFRAERQHYYEERLTKDAEWMTQCFKEHFDKCFLQCYSRKAWIAHRLYAAEQAGISAFAKEGEKTPKVSDPSTITVEDLNVEIPLTRILDIYEAESVAEVTRDAFLKAARRVADGKRQQ